jgi:hypothetical protein
MALIFHGSMVKRLTLARLRAYRHEEGFGMGVSFSRDQRRAAMHSNTYGSVVVADDSRLRLYELQADEQLFRRTHGGGRISSLAGEGYDGIDFAHCVAALALYDECQGKPDGFRVGRFVLRGKLHVPFVEKEVFIFGHALERLSLPIEQAA